MRTSHKFIKLKSIKMLGAVATLAVAMTAIVSNASAWGPTDRKTYTNESPADYATFNSITDNVAVGDERNFVRIREAGTSDEYVDEIEVIPGHEYEVYIYYHNDAGSDTNSKGYGMATDTRMISAYPTVVNSTERGMISGIITWSYVTPQKPNDPQEGKVWDEAYVTSQSDGVVLKYKTGTAIIHNSGDANGSVLPTALFSDEGTPIGFNKLAGTIPGCAEYSGHVTYTLVAENPGSELDKQVSTDGENWFDEVTVKPGDIVTYKVAFRNTGNTNFTNLIFTDTHDAGLSLYSGTTKIYDYQHVDGYAIDDIIDISGYNTGDILAGGLVQATYQMRVAEDTNLCGKTLINTMTAAYNSTENKTDSTAVKVSCETPETPGTPETPVAEDCSTNPNLPGCQRIPDTGPREIILAIVIILGIGAGGFYFWRTHRTLKTVEGAVSGPTESKKSTPADSNKTENEPKAGNEPTATPKDTPTPPQA